MNKQWIYRNGEKPFSVTELLMPDGDTVLLSVSTIGIIRNHFSGGVEIFSEDNQCDLIPYEPYSDFKIDDKVNAYDDHNLKGEGRWYRGPYHFAGLDADGRPTTFWGGGTSFTRTADQTSVWDHCEKANKEDK